MSGDQCALELGDHGVLEAEDPRPRIAAFGQRSEQVLQDFLLHAPLAVAGSPQLADGPGKVMGLSHHSTLRLSNKFGTAPSKDSAGSGYRNDLRTREKAK